MYTLNVQRMMRHLRAPRLPNVQPDAIDHLQGRAMIRLWVLRMLNYSYGYRLLTRDFGLTTGLVQCMDIPSVHDISYAGETDEAVLTEVSEAERVLKMLPTELAKAEASTLNDLPHAITSNIHILALHMGLTGIEKKLLMVIAMFYQNEFFRDVLSNIHDEGAWQAKAIYAVMIGENPEKVRAALSPIGTLIRCGILVATKSRHISTGYCLKLLSDYFAERLLSSSNSAIELLQDHINPVTETALSLTDFSHVAHEVDLLKRLIERSLLSNKVGCNVLVYGVPGTGKTELARVIAKELGHDLYDISCVDTNSEAINGLDRLRAYIACQHLFEKAPALIVFDELEDLFNDSDSMFGRSSAQQHKGRITRLLEENQCPTLWISNQVDCLDPAFIRRFDMVLELPIPPYERRAKMVEPIATILGLTTEHAHRISLCPDISPAVLERSGASIKRMQLSKEPAAKALDYLINSTLKAQHYKPMATVAEAADTSSFAPLMTNIEGFDSESRLIELAERVVQLGQGRLCLHGPSGSGKTAFARWLASKSERPLCLVSGSDLISAQVGQTEENIALLFMRAEQDGSILLIDEVDSFLRSRERAEKSWEITAVNEMLVQIERFSGILMVTTNFFSSLDAAALRRFDVKLNFGYLKPKQAWRRLQQFCEGLGITQCSDHLESEIGDLSNLTAGDFTTLNRRNNLLTFASADAVMQALRVECGLKSHAPKRTMGFVG